VRDAAQHRLKLCRGYAHKSAAWTGKASAKPMLLPHSACSWGKAYEPSQVLSYDSVGLGVTRFPTASSSGLTMCIPSDSDISKPRSLGGVQLAQHTPTVMFFSPELGHNRFLKNLENSSKLHFPNNFKSHIKLNITLLVPMSTFPQQRSLLDHVHPYVHNKMTHANKCKTSIKLDKLAKHLLCALQNI